jgi:RNA polymerase sigma-70 factor (ECF subfamily)
VATLSPSHRAVLHEVYFADRTCREAAVALGIPEGTVKSRLYHALRRLRLAIEEEQL